MLLGAEFRILILWENIFQVENNLRAFVSKTDTIRQNRSATSSITSKEEKAESTIKLSICCTLYVTHASITRANLQLPLCL